MDKNILVATLNWGLGHATRCIPIIKALEQNNFTPIIASDGAALALLQKEFPHLQTLELPSYHIQYPKNGANFKWKMLKNIPKMIEAIFEEKKLVKKWLKEFNLIGIISDNRLGVRNKKVPSVFISHQLNVLTGNTTWLTSKIHQKIIEKYNECWVPDFEEAPGLTGKLGHLKNPAFFINYIGPLSRFEKKKLPKKHDLMVLLSGPEPQRGILENLLKNKLLKYNGNVIFIKGIVEPQQNTEHIGNILFYNFMTTTELENTFNESELILCRSGYTSIMDLVKLNKKAFLIPTPGQYEQEYLAKKMKEGGFFPFAKQDDFTIENLEEIYPYQELNREENPIHWKQLFSLFKSE